MGAEGERGQRPIQRTGGAARNKQIKPRARRRKRLSWRGFMGTGGERSQWLIQRTGGAARNKQATDREHAMIERREPSFSRKKVPPGVTSPSFR